MQPLPKILNTLYPLCCPLCDGTSTSNSFCDSCSTGLNDAIHEKCQRCGADVGPYAQTEEGCKYCRETSFHFTKSISFGSYSGLRRDAVFRLKTHIDEVLAKNLVSLWLEKEQLRFQHTPIDCILPVPLHWIRRFVRGHNSAYLLARELSHQLRKPLVNLILRRTKHLPPQTSLPADQRKSAIKNAFSARIPSRWKHASVLLVDDVMTTGSTMQGCAKALHLSGISQITPAVFCRAFG